MRLDKAIEGFLLFKSSEGLTDRTLQTYRHNLAHLLAYFGQDTELNSMNSPQLIQFFDYMRREYRPVRWNGNNGPLASQTLRNIWVAIRSFYTWAAPTLQIPDVMNVPPPRATNKERVPFTEAEIKALLKVVKPIRAKKPRSGYRFNQHLRDYAIILVLLDTGVRVSELINLNIGDVHLKTGRISIHGKGGKHRYVRLADVSRKAVWQYLAEREDGDDPAAPLLITANNKRMSRYWLRKRLKQIGDKADVAEVYPHRFRHTFAVQYLRNGGDVFTLQMLLGHSSLKMVRHYARLADVDTERVHAFASPVDRWLK